MEKKQLCLIGVSGYSGVISEHPRRALPVTSISTKGAEKLNKVAIQKPFVFRLSELPMETPQAMYELHELALHIEESPFKNFIGLIDISIHLDVSLFFEQHDYNISSSLFPDTRKVTEKEKERYVVYVANRPINEYAPFISFIREADAHFGFNLKKPSYPFNN